MARRFALQDRDRGYRSLLRNIGGARSGTTVKVGFQGPRAEEQEHDADLTVVEIAAIHEFGFGNVPERSMIRAWVDQNGPAIKRLMNQLADQVIKGEINIKTAMDRFGIWAVGQIQLRIADGIEPKLADSTIAHKGSSVPLINTGQMRSAITHLVDQRMAGALAGALS
jgi:hypothetical protein